jgi:hypothetical protein
MMPRFRRFLALAICPELSEPRQAAASAPDAHPAGRKAGPAVLIELANALAEHQGVTHWAISMRLAGRGDLFSKLERGADVRMGTYERLLRKFSACWPEDLAWPEGVPRPDPAEDAA